jgi:hypothetical protein
VRQGTLRAVTIAALSFTASTALAANLDYYRQALESALSLKTPENEFLLMNLPQPLGDPGELDASGSPMDMAFMDVVPHEQFEWVPSSARVSSAYASLFESYRLGYRAHDPREQRRYEEARSRLYQPPDPALVARGELPAFRLTDRAADYFLRNGMVLSRLVAADRTSAGISDLLDVLVGASAEGEISKALATIRRFQQSDVDAIWAARSTAVESGSLRTIAIPERGAWGDESGWVALVIPSVTNGAIAVSLQVKLVRVERPWLDERLFEEKNWYSLDSSDRMIVVSTGEALAPGGGGPGGALLPLLPVEFLLARKVQRIGVWTLADEQALPLSLRPSVADLGVGSAPAVIAVICKRVPQSPQPDPSLDWPGGSPP